MAVELRPATAVLVLVVVLVAGSFGSVVVAEATSSSGDSDAQAALRTVPLDNSSDQLWLYTSRGLSFESATLAINVVVYGDPGQVQQGFLDSARGNWTETESDEQEVAPDENLEEVNATAVEWEAADGANRYAYLQGLQRGIWLTESYQVHDGTYLGSRHHVRAYTSPDGDDDWTAIQAHHEHWDWFFGRHIVTSIDESQTYVEREFAASGNPEITRMPVASEGGPSFDQWLTIVDFRSTPSESSSQSASQAAVEATSQAAVEAASESTTASLARSPPQSSTQPGASAIAKSAVGLLVLVLGSVQTRLGDVRSSLRTAFPEQDARTFFLGSGMVVVLLFVRLAGIALEGALDVPPKTFAVGLYPVLFVGLPVVAYLLARPLGRARAFSGASVGFLAGVLLDYSYLGVTHLPLDILVHRGAMAVALGLVAVGGSRVERRNDVEPDHVRAGALLWLVATVYPLLRHTPLPV